MKTRTILIGLGVGLCIVAALISISVVRAGDTVPPSTQETETTIIWDDLRCSDLIIGGDYISVGFAAEGRYIPMGTKVRIDSVEKKKVRFTAENLKYSLSLDVSDRVPFIQVFKVKGKFALANYNRR